MQTSNLRVTCLPPHYLDSSTEQSNWLGEQNGILGLHLKSIRKDYESATQRSDMYSLGIVLNEIMTLRKPFENFPWDKVTKEGLEARHNLRQKVMTGARPSTFFFLYLY